VAVRVITDSSAGLPPELAEQLSITVIDLHLMESHGKDGLERSTSGLSALELAAAYGREMERAQDEEWWPFTCPKSYLPLMPLRYRPPASFRTRCG